MRMRMEMGMGMKMKRIRIVEWILFFLLLQQETKIFVEMKDDFVSDPLFSSQWYLHSGEASSLSVLSAWERNLTGKGVNIGVISNGMWGYHDDLVASFSPEYSYNYLDHSPNVFTSETLGTQIGGLITSTNNDICTIGVAYEANLSTIVVGKEYSDKYLGAALSKFNDKLDIYCHAWQDQLPTKTFQGIGPNTQYNLYLGARNGRSGKGNIFISSAPDLYSFSANTAYNGISNSPYIMTVSGIGRFSPFISCDSSSSCFHVGGPGLLAVVPTATDDNLVPSISFEWDEETMETPESQCASTPDFKNRHIPAALTSGIVALILESRDDLTWFDVQHVIALSSNLVDDSNEKWKWNGASLRFNEDYGFGVIDVKRALAFASTLPSNSMNLSLVASAEEVSIPNDALELSNGPVLTCGSKRTIPFQIQRQKDFEDDAFLMHVIVDLWDVDSPYCGDLNVELHSPSNTMTTLLSPTAIKTENQLSFIQPENGLFLSFDFAPFGPALQNETEMVVDIYRKPSDSSDVCGCRSYSLSELSEIEEMKNRSKNVAILLYSSKKCRCSTTVKTKNAQRAGAAALIVVLESGVSVAQLSRDKARDVTIPTILISSSDGEIFDTKTDYQVQLVSKRSKESVRMPSKWSLLTVFHWRENFEGTWNLIIQDCDPYDEETAIIGSPKLKLLLQQQIPIETTPSPTPTPFPTPSPFSLSFPPTPSPFSVSPTPPSTSPTPPSTSSASPSSTPSPSHKSGHSTGAIVMGVIWTFILTFALCAGAFLLYLKFRKPRKFKQIMDRLQGIEEEPPTVGQELALVEEEFPVEDGEAYPFEDEENQETFHLNDMDGTVEDSPFEMDEEEGGFDDGGAFY